MKFDIKIALLAMIGVTWATAFIPKGTDGLTKRSFSAGAKNVVITDPALIRSAENRAAKAAAAKAAADKEAAAKQAAIAATSGIPMPKTGPIVQAAPTTASTSTGTSTGALKASVIPPVPTGGAPMMKAGMAPPVPKASTAKPAASATGPITMADVDKAKANLKPVNVAPKPATQSFSVPSASQLQSAIAGLKKVGTGHLENKQIKPSVDTNPIVNPTLLAQRIAGLKKVETKGPMTPLELHKAEMEQKKKAEEAGKAAAEAAAKAAVEAKAEAAKATVKVAEEAKPDAAKPVQMPVAQIVASTVPANTGAGSAVPIQAAQKVATVDASTAAAKPVQSTVPANTVATSPAPTQTTQKAATVDAPTKTEQGSLKPKEVFHHEHVHNHYHHFVKAA